MQSGYRRLRYRLCLEGHLGGNLRSTHGNPRLFGLQLAVARRLGVARSHTGRGLGSATGAGCGGLRRSI